MTREFAWKPRWAMIRLVNSWERSTFDRGAGHGGDGETGKYDQRGKADGQGKPAGGRVVLPECQGCNQIGKAGSGVEDHHEGHGIAGGLSRAFGSEKDETAAEDRKCPERGGSKSDGAGPAGFGTGQGRPPFRGDLRTLHPRPCCGLDCGQVNATGEGGLAGPLAAQSVPLPTGRPPVPPRGLRLSTSGSWAPGRRSHAG